MGYPCMCLMNMISEDDHYLKENDIQTAVEIIKSA